MEEECKIDLILKPTIPQSYEDLQTIIKKTFNGNINNLSYNNETSINENNYNKFYYSIYELSYIKRQKFIEIKPLEKNENLDEIKAKFEQNKKLLDSHKEKNKIFKEENKMLETELDNIKKKRFDREIKEIILLNEKIGQKYKIINGFEEFKNQMKKSDQNLKNELSEINNKYNNFDEELKKILEDIKEKIYDEILKQLNESFKKKLDNISNSENELMKNYNKELKNINYVKLIKESENAYNIECSRCKNNIIGILYKCEKCNENPYYLCEICEEKNYNDKKHPHFFVKVRKRQKLINNEAINKNKN